MPLGFDEAARALAPFGVDADRPIMAQVSRFDPWKDPLGVVDAYRLVKKQIPGIQLIMIGPTAADDPEGLGFFEKTARRAGGGLGCSPHHELQGYDGQGSERGADPGTGDGSKSRPGKVSG